MEIRYHLSIPDLEDRHLRLQPAHRRGWGRDVWRDLSLWVVFVFSLALLAQARDNPYPPWVWALAGGAFFGSALWIDAWVRSGWRAQWAAQFAGDYALSLSAAGISVRAPEGRVGFYAWPEVAALESAAAGLYVYLGRDAALSVPRRGVPEETLAAFAEEARRLWGAHPAHAGKSLPELLPAAESWVRQGWANLRAASRLVLFREFDAQAFRATHGALAVLLGAQLGLFGLADYIEALPAPLFSPAGVRDYAATVLLTLAWAAYVFGHAALRAALLRLLVMVTAATLAINSVFLPVYLAGERLMPDADRLLWGLYAASQMWAVAVVFRVARRTHRQSVPAAFYIASSYAVLMLALAVLLPGHVYVSAEDEQAAYASGQDDAGDAAPPDPAAGLDAEDVLYRQPELVKQALASVQPRRPDETGLYFVGFAGDASEREFGNEVRYAWDLLDRRFNTAGHSLALINDRDTVDQLPLANTHNMQAVLQGLASRMDKQKDVLFLFLSSHGAQDHRLAVSFSPLGMNDLRAETLKQLLDQSGIRNRVIVISACYSGGFLDVLKDDNTLILTASSRDHVAYGCGNVTEYTYFGEAYFVNALERQDSFIAAFDEARRLIAAREKKEGVDASGPQIHVGRNIERVLKKLKVVEGNGCPQRCSGESG